jgi:hypothetical protein
LQVVDNCEAAAIVSGGRGKKLGVMQPYFLPYIGYFQLIAAVDVFVVYDNIKYTKKGWINRNRMLRNGSDMVFSLPLKKDSDFLTVVERSLSADFSREKLLSQFRGAYHKAPYFAETFALLQRIIGCSNDNLFRYVYNSLTELCAYLEIKTEILVSSDISIDHGFKSQDKILALCEALEANTYVNPAGGVELYSSEDFNAHNIELCFLRSKPFEYSQFSPPFISSLSIVDLLMFNDREAVRSLITHNYEMI